MEQYLMYLRKSRADRDAADEPVMQTLQRHKARLDEYCRSHLIYIPQDNVLFEVSSADSIASRPMMMELLHRVETGAFTAVLCIDMDRLSRGSGADQALVINTFKYSDTKIITPSKTYDFANETDEQFAELGLFLGRNEYRQIKKRMRQGKIDAVKEGKYPSANPPYGYKTYKLPNQKGYSLQVIPEQAEVVKLIYDMYTHEGIGGYVIAKRLNVRGYRDQFGNKWSTAHITKILSDPTYTGKVRYAHRSKTKEMQHGQLVTVNKRNPNELIYPGLHSAIISEEVFEAAEEIRSKAKIPHTKASVKTRNPLCGLIECPFCKKKLALRTSDNIGAALYCPTPGCQTRGAYLKYVEKGVINALDEWLKGYVIETDKPCATESNNLQRLKDEHQSEQNRQRKIYDLLEREIYSLEEYQTRIAESKARSAELEEAIADIESELESANQTEAIVPAVQTVLEKYYSIESAAERNAMLRNILEKIVYHKTVFGRTHGRDFTLILYPKIPKINPL